jgi:hypothetical protein
MRTRAAHALAHVAHASAAAHTLMYTADLLDDLSAQLVRLLVAHCRNGAALRLVIVQRTPPSENAERSRTLFFEIVDAFDSARRLAAAFADCVAVAHVREREREQHERSESECDTERGAQCTTFTMLADYLVASLGNAPLERAPGDAQLDFGNAFSVARSRQARSPRRAARTAQRRIA